MTDKVADLVLELASENRRLKAVLDRLTAERQWRPIADAPMDGTTIIGWWNEARIAVSVYYDDGVWIDDHNCVEAPEPTHWMPLPDPPAENERPTESV